MNLLSPMPYRWFGKIWTQISGWHSQVAGHRRWFIEGTVSSLGIGQPGCLWGKFDSNTRQSSESLVKMTLWMSEKDCHRNALLNSFSWLMLDLWWFWSNSILFPGVLKIFCQFHIFSHLRGISVQTQWILSSVGKFIRNFSAPRCHQHA